MHKADTYTEFTDAFLKDWRAVVTKIVQPDGTVTNRTGMLSPAELPWSRDEIAANPIGALKAVYTGRVWSIAFNGTVVAFALNRERTALLMFVIEKDGTAHYVTDCQDHPTTIFRSPDAMKD